MHPRRLNFPDINPNENSISDRVSKPKAISVHTFALVDDAEATREHWIRLLESFDDFKCVAACPTGEEALRVIPSTNPKVILMDIFMPGMSGITCTAQLKVALPKTQILIFSARIRSADGFEALLMLERAFCWELIILLSQSLYGKWGSQCSQLHLRRVCVFGPR